MADSQDHETACRRRKLASVETIRQARMGEPRTRIHGSQLSYPRPVHSLAPGRRQDKWNLDFSMISAVAHDPCGGPAKAEQTLSLSIKRHDCGELPPVLWQLFGSPLRAPCLPPAPWCRSSPQSQPRLDGIGNITPFGNAEHSGQATAASQ